MKHKEETMKDLVNQDADSPKKVISLLPYAVNMMFPGDPTCISFSFPMSSTAAHTNEYHKHVAMIDLVADGSRIHPMRIGRYLYDAPANLPDPQKDTYYLVLETVARAASDRTDLLIPDKEVRDEENNLIGYESLRCLGPVLMWE